MQKRRQEGCWRVKRSPDLGGCSEANATRQDTDDNRAHAEKRDGALAKVGES